MRLKSLSLCLCLTFSGCFFYPEPVTQKPVQNKVQTKQVSKIAIKGKLTSLVYNGKHYCYTIVSTDTTYAKLPKAEFCSPRQYANEGDLVFASFVDKKLEKIYVIFEAKKKSQERIIKSTKREIKKDIEVPQNENISFD
ncbi:MAG: hypothetical protein K5978_02015 [Campylobacter sp.]|nr:hypothetical protein [Campylobacter sp.]